MGGSAGRKDVRQRAGRGGSTGPSRGKKKAASKKTPAKKTPAKSRPAPRTQARRSAPPDPNPGPAPNFTASKDPGRTDATDWSCDEFLVDQEFGFKWKQRCHLLQRAKELQAAADELKEELLGALDIADLEEVAVENQLVKRYKQESAIATEAFLLEAGVKAADIAKAKALSLKAYRKKVAAGEASPWRISGSAL